LVEDNLINQEVASEFLKQVGCNVIIASNGYEAINIVDDSFDIVLMDLQMPGIDGFETTKRIRKIYAALPIIAMTAAVMQKDIEQCSDAGMNGHISKPFEISDMLLTMAKWMPNKIINTSTEDIDNDIININGLDTVYALPLFNNNRDFYISILKKFVNGYKDRDKVIKKYLLDNDIISVKEELHTLKGISGNIGAINLNKICENLEKNVNINIDLKELEVELKLICDAIDSISLTHNDKNENIISFDFTNAIDTIDKFIEDITYSNIISKDEIDKFKNIIGHYGNTKVFLSFIDAIDSFDYEDANKLLKQLKNIIERDNNAK
jgi:CheY-like chemotaxis protein